MFSKLPNALLKFPFQILLNRVTIKGLLIGMAAVAGFCFVGCSDDVIDVNNQEVQVDNTPAYLSVSFSANASSSRSTADDVNNKGDQDGDREHSGHINLGTDVENKVNTALVVIKSTTKGVGGYAQLYGTNEETNNTPGVEIEKGTISEETIAGETVYKAGEPIELTANTFKVLVVVNPYKNLYADYENSLVAGTRNDAVVDALFTRISDGKYNTENVTNSNFASQIVTESGIMMANKELPQVKLAPNQTQTVEIPIERVASKITFRITNGNVYPIEVPDPRSVKIVTGTFTDSENTTHTLNKATYEEKEGEKSVVWIEFITDSETQKSTFVAAYKQTGEGDNVSYEKIENFTYDANKAEFEYTYEVEYWYVKLQKYALVNLSKSVFNVRHIIANTEEEAATTVEDVPFGKLDGNNFLYTPNWETTNNSISGINAVEFNDNGTFKNIENTEVWFHNTLAQVSDESNTVVSDTKEWRYFTDLKDSYTDLNTDAVYPNEDVENYDKQHQTNLQNIGYPLAYCLENSTDIPHQTHGLSTGITFMAQIYDDQDCNTAIKTMYRYKGYAFSSIDNIKKAFPNDENLTNLTDNSSNPTDFEKAGVTKYDSNTCYYYTTEIKHFDNNLPLELGNMEFAIMRNNIYSLAVTGIEKIGDPYVDPIPSTPNEIAKPKLTVEAKIMPWIVRYHDIEFNK